MSDNIRPRTLLRSVIGYFAVIVVWVTVLVGGLLLLENHFKGELDKLGWLSRNEVNLTPFGRRISGYTISENVPNYEFEALNDSFNVVRAFTDSNGFYTGGLAIQKQKCPNTIRIFLTGGSAAWGSIESQEVMQDTTYPAGSYCYEASIAGKLKNILQRQYPRINFEVINAAVVMYQFHQSFALYFERLHDFSPDVIINFDGYNDRGNMLDMDDLGDPYLKGRDQMEEQMQIATMARLPQRPYTLAYYNYKYVRQQGLARERKPSSAPVSQNQTVIPREPRFKSYQTIRPYLKISQKMLWLISAYEQQLRADGVLSLFCLQPTLQRRTYQKELSSTELRFRTFLDRVTVADTLTCYAEMKARAKLFPQYERALESIGEDRYWEEVLIRGYIFNDLSPLFDSIVQANGGAYLDVNKAMMTMGSDKEFYVDYCHLTPYGNDFVAKLLADKLAVYISRYGKDKR